MWHGNPTLRKQREGWATRREHCISPLYSFAHLCFGLTLEYVPRLIILMVRENASGLLCGEVAKAAGVSADTVRHYEKIGVLPKAHRSPSGYRIYPQSAVERVAVVQRALRIGFTLAELSEVLKARDAGGAPCRRVFELAQMKLRGIVADIAALKQTERYLKKVLTDWEQQIQRAGKGERMHLLHSLTDVLKNSSTPTNRIRRRRT
jgi:DNA-binding transcriptional MerR regulator